MNTSETPLDGVWFRDNPNLSGPRLNGYGVYAGDRVQLQCYGTGASIGPYANHMWYRGHPDQAVGTGPGQRVAQCPLHQRRQTDQRRRRRRARLLIPDRDT